MSDSSAPKDLGDADAPEEQESPYLSDDQEEKAVIAEAIVQSLADYPAALARFEAEDPAELLKRDNIRHLLFCENHCELLRSHQAEKSAYYLDNIQEFSLLTRRYAHAISQGMLSPLGVRYFGEDIGNGLITLVDLQAGDFIGQYTGVIQVSDGGLAYEHRRGYSSDYAWDYPNFPDDWPDIEISAELAGNALRYANHSFEPNCRAEHILLEGRWILFFIADSFISAGSQLLVNYGEEYWASEIRSMVYL